MIWILTTQTLVFAGICTLAQQLKICNNPIVPLQTVLFELMLIVGFLTAFSSVYSSLISELSIGSVLEDWNKYDKLPVNKKPNPVEHRIIVVPDVILKCKLKWLDLHAFVPKVFLAAWIVLIMYAIWGTFIDFHFIYIMFYYEGALLLVYFIHGLSKLVIILIL